MRVSHETIYRSLFIQAREALKKAGGKCDNVQLTGENDWANRSYF